MTMTSGPHFNGPDYVPSLDHRRLTDQHRKIRALMLDGRWRTLHEIAEATGESEASVSAQLRHLRKPRFGSYVVDKRRRGQAKRALFEYRVMVASLIGRQESEQLKLTPHKCCPCVAGR